MVRNTPGVFLKSSGSSEMSSNGQHEILFLKVGPYNFLDFLHTVKGYTDSHEGTGTKY